MISSVFLTNENAVLIADASIVINLNASGCALKIIEAVPGKILIPDNASAELAVGESFGHDDAKQLDTLIAAKMINKIKLGNAALAIYESLIDGSLGKTLDDGEAATIACAIENKAIAFIDEKKARRICAEFFPTLTIGCSVELLLNATTLGKDVQIQAIMNALRKGRMRVPPEFVDAVIDLIGSERAAECPSLPRAVRKIAA